MEGPPLGAAFLYSSRADGTSEAGGLLFPVPQFLTANRTRFGKIALGAEKGHDDARLHHRCQVFRVPVGEPNAAMRGTLADHVRLRRPVNAISVLREFDPHRTDGIVRTRSDPEWPVGVHA